MANLAFQAALAGNAAFQSRVLAALVNAAVAIVNEVANEVQTVSVSGSPTGGSFTLTSLPGTVLTQNGTTTNASASVTGLSTTAGLFVGMAVSGTNVPAGATVATITSATAITLSANATGAGTVPLTFQGGGSVVVPFNATAGQVQNALAAAPGVGQGDVACTGGPLPGTPVVATFTGALAGTPMATMTIGSNNLTGGTSPTPSVARTTPGVAVVLHAARAAQAARILYGGYDLYRYALAAAGVAAVQADFDASLNPTANEATIATDVQNAVSANWNSFN